jgi:ATP-binding cassette subfamily B multidrug efflux pump
MEKPEISSLQDTPESLAREPFRFYFRKHRALFFAGMSALFFTNLFDALTPLSLKFAIDELTTKNLNGLSKAILIYTALMTAQAVFRYFWRLYWGRFHHTVAEDLRNRIFAKFTVFGPSFYQKHPVGALMSLIINDVNSFRMGIGPGLLILFDGIFYSLFIVPLMLWLSPSWTWKTLIFVPFVPFLMHYMEKLIHQRYRVEQDRLAEVSGQAQEIISGVRVIKSYAQEGNRRSAFNRISRSYEEACNSMARADSAFEPLMDFSVAAGGAVLLYVCTPEVMRGAITLGTFYAFYEYIRKMIWPMTAIGAGVSMMQQGRASFDRIRELLVTETDIPDEGNVILDGFKSLEIRNLTFQYPAGTVPVLEDISLDIHAGETIGFVGPVGCGKTTLMNLIARLFPVESGKILINGIPVDQIKQKSLHSVMSYVPQDAFLFSDTIAENVALGVEDFPGVERVRDVTRVVNIDQEIESVHEGYQAHIGERGVNLSGGQKQRLTIARALIRNSPVVILDDSLSAVDGKTERSIVQSLQRVLSSRGDQRQTTLIVSHRLATLKHADRIVVLFGGRIEAIGKHEQLLTISPTYRELEQLQSEQKLAAAGNSSASLFSEPEGAK